ncbi:MAG TPA: ACT domain-containing protein, partial [Actinomycetota bacterium]|nr:ACT domain-containing protein [Actinomycetota bacterium]
LVECPHDVPAATVEDALMSPRSDLGLEMIVREVDGQPSTEGGQPFVISVYGADRPGIVHGFAQLLAERAVNITNLLSHAADGLYTIVLEVAVSPSTDEAELKSALSRLGASLEVTTNFRSVDTSEL